MKRRLAFLLLFVNIALSRALQFQSRLRVAHLVGLILAISVVHPVRAEYDKWIHIGPKAGNVCCLAIHPASTDTIYASGENGVYRSIDAGESWEKLVNLQTIALDIVFNPKRPHIIYARSHAGLYKSSIESRII